MVEYCMYLEIIGLIVYIECKRQNFLKVVVHVIIIAKCNQTAY